MVSLVILYTIWITASWADFSTINDGLRFEEKSNIKCTVSLSFSARTYAILDIEEQRSSRVHPGLNSADNYILNTFG